MNAKEVLKILHKDGWTVLVQKGSHIQLVHFDKTGKVTVPMHSGDIAKGTLHSIFKQAGIKK